MIYETAIYLLLAASMLCIARALRGPSIPDRVLAADAFVSITVSIIALLSLEMGDFLMDVAIVYALLGFAGTLAISKYLEGRRLGE